MSSSSLARAAVRPRILYDLSRHLAIFLEKRLELPVYLCHPDDAEDARAGPAGHAVGVLYPWSVVPERRYPGAPLALSRPGGEGVPEEPALVRRRPPWVRLRYVFLVAGGSLEDELGVLGGLFQALHEEPYLPLGEVVGTAGALREAFAAAGVEALPVAPAGEPVAWRELGLETHRRTVSFDVSVPLPSPPPAAVPAVLQRDLELEDAPGEGGG